MKGLNLKLKCYTKGWLYKPTLSVPFLIISLEEWSISCMHTFFFQLRFNHFMAFKISEQ